MAEEDLPVDIPSAKLVEWLVSRNKVKPDWNRAAQALRSRLDLLRGELPMDLKAEMEGQPLHYWAVEDVIERLERREEKEKGGKLKNMFGRYNSQQLHDWEQARKAFRKNNVHLAEAGRQLSQDVVYEVPVMKRTLQQNEKQISDLQRRVADAERGAREYRKKFADACEKMGVSGRSVRKELKQSVRTLGPLLHEVEQMSCGEAVVDAVEYYRAFVRFCLEAGGEEGAGDAAGSLLPAYDLIRAAADGRRERGEVLTVDDGAAAGEGQEEEGAADAGGAEIDWGISLEDAGAAADEDGGADGFVQIDWDAATAAAAEGDADVTAVDSGGEETGGGAAVIDWGISLEGGGEDGGKEDGDDDDDDDDDDSGERAGADSTLDDSRTRASFLTDLLELDAFLLQRLHETRESGSSPLYASKFASAPTIVQRQQVEVLEARHAAVKELLGALQSPRLQQLLLIRSSERYVDRLATSITQKLDAAERLEQSSLSFEARRAELVTATERTARRLRQAVANVKALQRRVEADLSDMFGGRRVNLFGDINNL